MAKDEALTIDDVLADVNHQIRRVAGAKAVETKAELVNNVYPLVVSMIEALKTRLEETEEVVAGILGETESIVQPELYDEIANAFNAGRALVVAISESTVLDDITKRRFAELAKDFVDRADATEALLADVALEDDGEDTDDEDEAS